MLCSSARLRGKDAFARFAHARHHHGKLLRVAVVSGSGLRCAFSVGKKYSVKAVVRNKLKRRLREVFRKWHTLLPEDTWLLFMPLPDAVNADFAALEADFKKLCGAIASKKSRDLTDKVV